VGVGTVIGGIGETRGKGLGRWGGIGVGGEGGGDSSSFDSIFFQKGERGEVCRKKRK